MPVRFPFLLVTLSPGVNPVLYSCWGANGYSRPMFTVHLYNPAQDLHVSIDRVRLDTGSDWIVFPSQVAQSLGLHPPFRRTVRATTASGPVAFSLPDDGVVGLLVTDYREYYYLPASPIGFWNT